MTRGTTLEGGYTMGPLTYWFLTCVAAAVYGWMNWPVGAEYILAGPYYTAITLLGIRLFGVRV